ncbi:MAG: hypothetical protein J6W63_10780 [Treponema sp.]|nr:hypothetical protein [Treponema sp.]
MKKLTAKNLLIAIGSIINSFILGTILLVTYKKGMLSKNIGINTFIYWFGWGFVIAPFLKLTEFFLNRKDKHLETTGGLIFIYFLYLSISGLALLLEKIGVQFPNDRSIAFILLLAATILGFLVSFIVELFWSRKDNEHFEKLKQEIKERNNFGDKTQ